MEKTITISILLAEMVLLLISLFQYNLRPGFLSVISIALSAALLVHAISRISGKKYKELI